MTTILSVAIIVVFTAIIAAPLYSDTAFETFCKLDDWIGRQLDRRMNVYKRRSNRLTTEE